MKNKQINKKLYVYTIDCEEVVLNIDGEGHNCSEVELCLNKSDAKELIELLKAFVND